MLMRRTAVRTAARPVTIPAARPAASGAVRLSVLGAARTACAAAALALVAGCGAKAAPPPDPDAGTNGIGKQPPAAIMTHARAAALAADSVHLSGTVVSGGTTYRLDMRLRKDAGSGSVTSGTGTFELLRVAGRLYVKGDAAFYTLGASAASASPGAAGAGTANKLDGKYVRVHATDPSYRQLSVFTDKAALLGSVTDLGSPAGKGAYSSVDGLRTVAVTTGSGTLRVSLEGTPYPVRVERARGAGTLNLTEFGKSFKVSPPPAGQVLDYGSVPLTGQG
jgi:hypothetical protein